MCMRAPKAPAISTPLPRTPRPPPPPEQPAEEMDMEPERERRREIARKGVSQLRINLNMGGLNGPASGTNVPR